MKKIACPPVSIEAFNNNGSINQLLKKYKLVVIEWVDSLQCSPNWCDIEKERISPPRCISTGFLISNGRYVKILYPHIGVEDSWTKESGLGGIIIPTKAIISIEELNVAK